MMHTLACSAVWEHELAPCWSPGGKLAAVSLPQVLEVAQKKEPRPSLPLFLEVMTNRLKHSMLTSYRC